MWMQGMGWAIWFWIRVTSTYDRLSARMHVRTQVLVKHEGLKQYESLLVAGTCALLGHC